MSTSRRQKVEELFHAAADLPADKRKDFLDRAEFDDAAMRGEIEKLIAHLEQAGDNFLASPPCAVAAKGVEGDDVALTQVGQFRIVRLIGEGGMGVVYEAQQEHPRRSVALKLIRTGMMSPALMKRFTHEADVLARLRHPGIAQIYEAGQASTPHGQQPYFAMELVRGLPLLAFARQHHLDVRRRLELLARVCDALQYAHEQGVIHRDLKPGNILVEESAEAQGQPKILDFGIAMVVSSDARGATMHTEVGQVLGTLGYMSPEQIAARPGDVDERTDVYSLGVILHELLTGRQPLDLRSCSLADAARMVRDQEPSRISATNPSFRGDIETIVAKALEKEKTRRYASPGALGADIRRHLGDKPIAARPASSVENMRKFARRNKALVGGIAGVILALTVGMIGTTVGFMRARRAESIALQRLSEVQRESAKAQSVSAFLQKMLSAVDPAQSKGREVTVLETIDDAASELEQGTLASQPDTEAEVRLTLGNTLSALGKYEAGHQQIEAAYNIRKKNLGEKDLSTIHTYRDLAASLVRLGDWAEAEKVYREVLASQERLMAADDPRIAQTMNSLAGVLRNKERYDEAQPMYERALEIFRAHYGHEHLDIAQSLNSLALLHQNKGAHDKAEDYFRQSLAMRKKLLGEIHPIVAGTLNNLGYIFWLQGKRDEAIATMQEALAMRRRLLGNEHPDVAQGVNNLAVFLYDSERVAESEPFFREAAELNRKLLGEKHPDYAANLQGLAGAARDLGHFEESAALFRESLDIRVAALGPDSWPTSMSHSGLATALLPLGRYAEAEFHAREALRIRESKQGLPGWVLPYTRSVVGAALSGQGKFTEAEALLVGAFDDISKVKGVPPARYREVVDRVATLYERMGNAEKAKQYQGLAQHPPKLDRS